jgi:hypothetical protein
MTKVKKHSIPRKHAGLGKYEQTNKRKEIKQHTIVSNYQTIH